jgi:hypothetical protein
METQQSQPTLEDALDYSKELRHSIIELMYHTLLGDIQEREGPTNAAIALATEYKSFVEDLDLLCRHEQITGNLPALEYIAIVTKHVSDGAQTMQKLARRAERKGTIGMLEYGNTYIATEPSCEVFGSVMEYIFKINPHELIQEKEETL